MFPEGESLSSFNLISKTSILNCIDLCNSMAKICEIV